MVLPVLVALMQMQAAVVAVQRLQLRMAAMVLRVPILLLGMEAWLVAALALAVVLAPLATVVQVQMM